MEIKDIRGQVLTVGDQVYYARKRDYTANGKLVLCEIVSFDYEKNKVKLKQLGDNFYNSNYTSTSPHDQLVKL